MNKLAIVALVAAAWFWWTKDPSVSVSNGQVDFGYKIEYPHGDDNGSRLPMLVALHGNGDTAKNFYATALDQIKTSVRVVLLKGPISYRGGGAWPNNRDELRRYGKAVNEAVMAIAAKYPTVGKPALLGFSGGAVMAYYQAAVYGDSYSYIFPVSGGLDKAVLEGEKARPGARVYAFHGKQDSVLSFNGGQQAVDLLFARKVRVKFTPFDGGHHGIFQEMKPQISALVGDKLARVN
ncbi:MAG: hypothetical protein AAF493_19345 [Pseudomonadota bacterium]